MPSNAADDSAVSFGPFRLCPKARLLEKESVPLHVGGRALDILILLVEHAGEVISNRDLVARVWPDVTVDEGSLRFHITGLRRALEDGRSGARYVVNVPGRGYCFVAPVSRMAASEVETASASPKPPQSLPARPTRMVGRDEIAKKIAEALCTQRFVTVVGPGGIGKTTVAVAVAHALLNDFDGAVQFLDLGSVHDARLVSSAMASALGLAVHSDDPVRELVAALTDKKMLIVADSCEHVIETAAPLTETIFKEAPQIHILATSRESLRVEGEHVHRLFPLACPLNDASLTASEALAFPAAQLFVERAAARIDGFELGDSDAPSVAKICQKLDGIALAIELAAGQVDAYGIDGIAALLESRFELSWQGRRTAVPRHQTMGAALDWSYALLSESERVVLRRLAVFVGTFTLEAARSIVTDEEIGEAPVVKAVGDLAAKSLISSHISAARMRYRLLDTTRAYVLSRSDGDERDATARRHAVYYLQYLAHLGADRSTAHREGDLPFAESIGDVRAALEWCFSAQGDLRIGIDLVATSAEFFSEMSLLAECYRWTERALSALDAELTGSRREMQLQEALAISLLFTQGNKEEVRGALQRGLELAESLGDLQYQLRILSGLHLFLTGIGDFRGALAISQRSEVVAKELGDPASIIMANWMSGAGLHLIGNQAEARRYCETALEIAQLPQSRDRTHLGHRRIIALVALARALWLQGLPDQAARTARYAVDHAASLGNAATISLSLFWSAYVFLWRGDWMVAQEIVEKLIAHTARHALGPHNAIGRGLQGTLSIKCGDPANGLPLVRSCLEGLRARRHQILISVFMTDLAEGLAGLGQAEAALLTIEDAIRQVTAFGDSFHMPEMLRIKADILASSDQAHALEAEDLLRRSLDRARTQSALGWELRTATTLARLWAKNGRAAEARALLEPVYARFTEGSDTADLRAAKALLAVLNELGS